MKRLAAALFGLCLIATSAVGFYQSRDSNYNIAISSGGGGSCTASTNFFARVTGLSGTEHTAYDTMICGLVTDGIITGTLAGAKGCGTGSFDVFYVFATNSITTANLNICGTSFGASQTGTITFTADVGYLGDGTTGFLNSGYNPSTSAGQMTQNSASIGICNQTSRTAATPAPGFIGSNDGTNFDLIQMRGDGPTIDLNDASFNFAPESNSQGSWIMTRTTSTNVNLYLNGSTSSAPGATSTGLPNNSLFLLAVNNNGTTTDFNGVDQASYYFSGPGFNSTQVTAIFSRLHTFLVAVNAANAC